MKFSERTKQAARLWLARRLPTCQQIAPVASRARDGQATLRQRVELRLHLTICELCARYASQLAFLGEIAEQTTLAKTSATLSVAARERLAEKLRLERQREEKL